MKLAEKQSLRQRNARTDWVETGKLVEVAEGTAVEEEVPAAGAQQGLAQVVAAGCGFIHCAFLIILIHHILGFLLCAAAGIGEPVHHPTEWRKAC